MLMRFVCGNSNGGSVYLIERSMWQYALVTQTANNLLSRLIVHLRLCLFVCVFYSFCHLLVMAHQYNTHHMNPLPLSYAEPADTPLCFTTYANPNN